MKAKDLAKYTSDKQEKEQLQKRGSRQSNSSEGVDGNYPTFETTGGKSPLTLNKRKGKTY